MKDLLNNRLSMDGDDDWDDDDMDDDDGFDEGDE